jgi:hypothetical protein
MDMGEIDAATLKNTAFLDDGGQATAAFDTLPRIASENLPIFSFKDMQDFILQAFKKGLCTL